MQVFRKSRQYDSKLQSLFTVAIGAIGSACSGAPKSVALDANSPELGLDRGDVYVHVGVMREVSGARRRLELTPLLDPKTVFDHLKGSRQQERVSSSSLQFGGGVDVSTGLALGSQTVKSTTSRTDGTRTTAASTAATTEKSGVTPDGATGEVLSSEGEAKGSEASSQLSSGSEKADTYGRMAEAAPLATRLTPIAPSTTALGASYHSLLYATAETILAGQGLEALFNVDALPEGRVFLTLPIVISVQPGRITRTNYVSETLIDLKAFRPCGIEGLSVVAVAPLGLSAFAGDSNLAARAIQVSASAGIPVGAALAQVKGGLTKEDIEALAVVARRPEVQVSIEGSIVRVRYLGNAGLEQTVHLTPTTLNVEAMILAQRQAFDESACRNALSEHVTSTSFDENGKPIAAQRGQHPMEGQASANAGLDQKLTLEKAWNISESIAQIGREARAPLPFDFSGAQGRTGGALLVGVTWMFVPTEKLSKGPWSWLTYSMGRWELSPLYVYARPPVRVSSLVQGPGGDLLATVAEGSDEGWRLCVTLKNVTAGGAVSEEKFEFVKKKADPLVGSLRFTLKKPLAKDAFAYVSARPFSTNTCDGDANWTLLPVKVVPSPQSDPAEKVIKVTFLQGALESAAIVVRVEYEAPTDQVVVRINGAAATIRSFEPRKKDGTLIGGTLYASIAQRLSRKDDLERRVRVDITAKDYPVVSTEIRAVW
jgi:hypothetical protein